MTAFANIPGTLARETVRTVVSLYYPNVVVTGRERIPADGPVLFVANHANSLMDPVIIGIASRRPIHFLAKAPLFDTPVLGPAMKALGMLPAYRGVDSRAQVAKNAETLAAAADCLARGEAVGIFPEGKSHDALHIDQVKTGAARMALQALAKGAKGLKIVPLGLNYERKEQFRSSVWVQVGEPVDAAAFANAGDPEDRHAMRELTKEIDQQLKRVVIHLGDASWEPFLRDLEILLPSAEKRSVDPISALRQRKRLADAINHFMEHDRRRALRVAVAIQKHREELAANGLTVRSLAVRYQRLPLWWRLASRTIGLMLGAAPALLGIAHHIIPFVLVRTIAPRFEAKGRTTTSLTRLGFGIPAYGIWYALVWWAMAKYFRPAVATAWAVCVAPAGLFALSSSRALREVAIDWWHELRSLSLRRQVLAWREQQRELGGMLGELERAYATVRPAEPGLTARRAWRLRAAFAVTALLVLLLGVLAAAWVRVSSRPEVLPELVHGGPRLDRLSSQSLARLLDDDEATLAGVIASFQKLENDALAVKAEFDSGKRSFFRQEDDNAIRRLLFRYLGGRTELLRLVWHYQGHDQVADERLRQRAFLVACTSGALLFDSSRKFAQMFEGSPDAIRKLNEAEPRWGIPGGLYETVRHNLQQPGNRQLLDAAWGDYQSRKAAFQRLGLASEAPYLAFHTALGQAMENISRAPLRMDSRAVAVAREARQIGREVAYRGQSLISTWVGDTRVREPREGRPLIQPDQLAQVRRQLRPGDVLIERQNWFLSRAFMPGYWAHAALYVGTPDELQRLGLHGDPRVAPHWEAFRRRDENGHEHVILEAVPRGVRMTTLEHCIGAADSAAALRPKLDEAALREAIAEAFSHLNKPYDFEFDFFSTDKLVCTELVYRCYDGAVRFDLVNVMGRMTLPPTELVRKYVADKQNGRQQFDFVLFLDGLESEGVARFSDETAFAGTVDRPSLTWLQEK